MAGDFETAYLNQDAEHKATTRSRKALPSDPAKRAKVLQNLMADDASKAFADDMGGTNPNELEALRMLAANLRVVVEESKQSNCNSTAQRQFRKIVAAVLVSKATRSARLLRETAKLVGLNYRRLCQGLVFRERLMMKGVNALFTL